MCTERNFGLGSLIAVRYRSDVSLVPYIPRKFSDPSLTLYCGLGFPFILIPNYKFSSIYPS